MKQWELYQDLSSITGMKHKEIYYKEENGKIQTHVVKQHATKKPIGQQRYQIGS